MSMCLAAAATVGSLTTPIAAAQPRNHTHRTLIAVGCWEQVGTVAETGGQPTPAEQVANIHRANLLGCEMLCFASNNTEVLWRLKHLVA